MSIKRTKDPFAGGNLPAFDFFTPIGGSKKPLSKKQEYFKAKRELDLKLENQRYSRKLDTIKAANWNFDTAQYKQIWSNAKHGLKKVGRLIKKR